MVSDGWLEGEPPREDQQPAELLQSNISAGVTSAEQQSSVGVVGSASDRGDGAKMLQQYQQEELTDNRCRSSHGSHQKQRSY
ncbi:hypothetical protein LIER_25765 [Lithospermum erythrorhizon]|uniref:Uncharacterized protein n=1 Tax=Lithospermum erythrorhizon TaxID=34254 RepID=A0AAV3R5Y8_LITER